MNLMLLTETTETPLTQKLLDGGLVALIGVAVVFAVLAIIWLSLVLFKYFMHDLPSKRKATTPVKEIVEAPAPVDYASADEEIIAVIAAAIAVAESENANLKFKVVSFRRI